MKNRRGGKGNFQSSVKTTQPNAGGMGLISGQGTDSHISHSMAKK